MNTLKIFVSTILASACLAGIAPSAHALTIGDPRDLGLINPNHPANPTDSVSFINILLSQGLGTGPTTIGANQYTRTTNDPLAGAYPSATTTGFVDGGSNVSGSVDLGVGGFLYLLAKYDGPNYGSVVWYVGGLTGMITIPTSGQNGQYGLSHYYLFNPNAQGVPDGGATVVLLGMAFLGLRTLRRRLA